MTSEIHEKTDTAAQDAQVVENLRRGVRFEGGHCFHFDQDDLINDQIREKLANPLATKVHFERRVGFDIQASIPESNPKGALTDCLPKTAAKFMDNVMERLNDAFRDVSVRQRLAERSGHARHGSQ